GGLWGRAAHLCSGAFDPRHGVNVRVGGCMSLVERAASAWRESLYFSEAKRLDEAVEGELGPGIEREGHTGTQPDKVEMRGGKLLGGPEASGTVCEIGFNSGHSSLNWLLSTGPRVRVLSFDIGDHPYVHLARDYLTELFPGRLEVILGDSTDTVPAFAAAAMASGEEVGVCNLLFVDGDHSKQGALEDIRNLGGMRNR
ncbi:unnamed protein product, partial [Discosporangium mesarthrocarpum]